LVKDIQKAIKNLPEIYEIPFIAHSEGYRYEDISVKLGVPIGTVKRRIHTARHQFKAALQEFQGHHK